MAGKYYAVRKGRTPGVYGTWEACKAMVDGYPGAQYKSFRTRAEAEAFVHPDGAGCTDGGGARSAVSGFGLGSGAGSGSGEKAGQAKSSAGFSTARTERAGSAGQAEGFSAAGAKRGGSAGQTEDSSAAGAKREGNAGQTADNYAFVDGSFNSSTGVYGYGGFLVAGGERYVLQGSGNEPELAGMRNVAGEVLGSMAAMERAVSLGLAELTVYYDYMGIEMWAIGAWKRNKKGTIAYYDYVQGIKDKLALRFVKVKGHSGVEGNEEADRLAKEAAGIGLERKEGKQ